MEFIGTLIGLLLFIFLAWKYLWVPMLKDMPFSKEKEERQAKATEQELLILSRKHRQVVMPLCKNALSNANATTQLALMSFVYGDAEQLYKITQAKDVIAFAKALGQAVEKQNAGNNAYDFTNMESFKERLKECAPPSILIELIKDKVKKGYQVDQNVLSKLETMQKEFDAECQRVWKRSADSAIFTTERNRVASAEASQAGLGFDIITTSAIDYGVYKAMEAKNRYKKTIQADVNGANLLCHELMRVAESETSGYVHMYDDFRTAAMKLNLKF